MRHALAVRSPVAVRLCARRGNGAAPSHMPVPSEMQPFGSALPGQAKGTVYQIAEVARNLRTKSPQRCALPPSMIAHSHLLSSPGLGPPGQSRAKADPVQANRSASRDFGFRAPAGEPNFLRLEGIASPLVRSRLAGRASAPTPIPSRSVP
jgi:hypothetical protein